MHTAMNSKITDKCFEMDDYNEKILYNIPGSIEAKKRLISVLENLRLTYLATKNEAYWKEFIRWLPESWLQTRTVTMSYENLLAMCSKGQRRFHKLNEWSGIHTPVDQSFIQMARELPYASDLIFIDEENENA